MSEPDKDITDASKQLEENAEPESTKPVKSNDEEDKDCGAVKESTEVETAGKGADKNTDDIKIVENNDSKSGTTPEVREDVQQEKEEEQDVGKDEITEGQDVGKDEITEEQDVGKDGTAEEACAEIVKVDAPEENLEEGNEVPDLIQTDKLEELEKEEELNLELHKDASNDSEKSIKSVDNEGAPDNHEENEANEDNIFEEEAAGKTQENEQTVPCEDEENLLEVSFTKNEKNMERNLDLNEDRNSPLEDDHNQLQEVESGEDMEPPLAPMDSYADDEEMETETDGRQIIELFDDDEMNIAENKVGDGGEEDEKMDVDAANEQLTAPEPQVDMQSSKVRSGVECINFECERKDTNFIVAPSFVLSLYKVSKKINKIQYVCEECYDKCIAKYQVLCQALGECTPIYLQHTPRKQEFVEILDSSDEDEEDPEKKVEPPLKSEIIDLVQSDLDSIISNVLSEVAIEKQVDWTHNILKDKISNFWKMSDDLSKKFDSLQKQADSIHNSLYKSQKFKIKELTPFDLNTEKAYPIEELDLPPWGEIKYPKLEIGGNYYAARNKPIGSWLPCRVLEALGGGPDKQKPKSYKVKFIKTKVPAIKSLTPKHIAYGDPPTVRLGVGSRVIALFDASTLNRFKDKAVQAIKSAFYPGIIAEELENHNNYRYLIFFDDGYAQYVQHKDVRIICECAENVWEDVHEASREFIRTYLHEDPKSRPMVQVKKGQSMMTESNGKWLYAKIVDVDASLVQMHFAEENRCEWIYLGSTRLGPLYKEKQKKNQSQQQVAQMQRRTEPYVRYFQNYELQRKQDHSQTNPPYRAVARKSTARPEPQPAPPQPTVKHLNNSTIYLEDDNRTRGKVVFYTAKKNMPPKRFVFHECNPRCPFSNTPNLKGYSPLAKPMLSGWERTVYRSKNNRAVVYRTPCGVSLRNMQELHRYLRRTRNPLNVDNFNFDDRMHCLAEYVIETNIVHKPDLSNGVESMVLPCINYYDNTLPPECTYSTKRIPTKGVNLNLDPAFLAGCNCEDDCSDKSKCACWRLTLLGAKFGNPNTPPENIGYVYKRLLDQVPTGIYECNVNCKCSKSCLNRVVQQPLQMKLQVFKTSNRGWGLRCLNDVPKGSFICIYAGHLLTEQMANEGGLCSGDEYFAELDYIEVVERLKEGYESDVPDEAESDDELDEPGGDESDEEFRSTATYNRDASINTRLRAKRGASTDENKNKDEEDYRRGRKSKRKSVYEEEDDVERQVINFEANTSLDNEEGTTSKYKNLANSLQDKATLSISSDESDSRDYDKSKKSKSRKRSTYDDRDGSERRMINFEANTVLDEETNKPSKYTSILKYYGKNEQCYIMDAKKTGNLGRYFNHSCSPNLFVQNVFVDTHDLRFPWVAFFALCNIKAGSELTWNYNYEVGIVPGKVLYCECGAPNCRGRLL